MKFLRHLLAVLVVISLVVSLGFLWSHSGAAGLVADGGGDRGPSRPPSGAAATSGASTAPSGRFDRRGNSGISLSNIDDLGQTVVVLGLILGGVVAIDRTRRRRRGATRRERLMNPQLLGRP